MSIPKQVLKGAKEAQELQEKIAVGNPGNTDPTPEQKTAPDGNPSPNPPEKIVEPAPQPDPEPKKAEEPEPKKESDDKPPEQKKDYWENRFNVLQGKYNSEIPALRNQVNTLSDQLRFLQNENITLKQNLDHAKQQPVDVSNMPDPESFREWGDEFVGMAKILKDLTSSIGSLKGDIGNIRQENQRIVETTKKSAWDSYVERVKQLPVVAKYDNDPGFIEWLQEVNPYTGQPRNAGLSRAHNSMDLGSVKAIFQEYADIQARINPPPTPQPTQSVQKKIEDISPSPASGAASAGTMPPPQGRTFTKEEINKFYRDVAQGRYIGREAEVAAREVEILDAGRTGRIIDHY